MPKKKKPEKMTEREKELLKLKLEVAEELGLDDKIKDEGWGGLTARETGRVGGHMSKKIRDREASKHPKDGG